MHILRYPAGYKGYKVLDLESHSISISRNVVFHEREFPFKVSEHLSSVVNMFSKTILPLLPPLHFVETMHLSSNAYVPLSSSAFVHPDTSASHARHFY